MLLKVEQLEVRYGRIQAVNGLDLAVGRGEVVTVLGANGAGKSSLLRAILGVEKVAGGSIRLHDSDMTRWPTSKRVKNGIVLVPEGRRILINQTIHENLLLGTSAREDKAGIEQDLDRIYTRFSNLAARRDMEASCLSGGEQQMLAIGRALMAKPELLMLDEPSLGLSPLFVQDMFALLRELNQEGLSILLVEQNTGMALQNSHRAYVLERGRCVLTGHSAELLDDERVNEAYLGQGS